MTFIRTRLCKMSATSSSFSATALKASPDGPTYTASSVSNELDCVSTVSEPLAVGVTFHQTDEPPGFAPWYGSPFSIVAPTFAPVVVDDGDTAMALVNASFEDAVGATVTGLDAGDGAPEPIALAATTVKVYVPGDMLANVIGDAAPVLVSPPGVASTV